MAARRMGVRTPGCGASLVILLVRAATRAGRVRYSEETSSLSFPQFEKKDLVTVSQVCSQIYAGLRAALT